MLTCISLSSTVQCKVTTRWQEDYPKIQKAMSGGMMDMTRMKYVIRRTSIMALKAYIIRSTRKKNKTTVL